MANNHTKSAKKYARDVVKGKIPACKEVKQACQRHLDDLEKSKKSNYPYKLDPEKGEKICKFAEKMYHIKGKWAGTKIVLESWQKFILVGLFAWIRKSDGLRRFREFYGEIPRKNAKSTLGAIIGLYMLTEDNEPGADIQCGASDLRQAYYVFEPAWLMVNRNQEFKDAYGLYLSGTHKNPSSVYSIESGSKFEPIIGTPGDGGNPHCALIDEYHEHRTDHLYDTMATGMGARTQPLLISITTAGDNLAGPCYQKRDQCLKLLSGKIKNDTIFAIIFTIDDDDDWTNFENWKKANPNFGVSVFEDYLKKQLLTALQNASKQNSIKCKHLNMWANAGVAWMNMVEWNKCKENISIEQFYGQDCWVGVDLASKIDLAAVVYMFKKNDKYYIFPHFYLPENMAMGEDKAHYAGWAHDEYITLTPGDRIDFDVIQENIKANGKKFDIVEIAHDPWEATQFITNMQKLRFNMIEIPQTVNHISEPMKELEALVKEEKMVHDGNPVMEWMMSNVVAKVDKKDNVFPYKEKNENKIDGPVAVILALKRAMAGKKKRTVMMPVLITR